jgi:cyclase
MTKCVPLKIALALWLLSVSPSPSFAQADFTGTWAARYQEDFTERIPGPDLGDYLGLPINAAARQFADSWDPSRITLPEEQCRVHVSPYIYRGPLNLRIWEERDPATEELVAIKHTISTYDQTRTIYMDGRPHPPEIAAHTWMGFSTGSWQGDMLKVTTTHIKQGWVRRNGLPMSDKATLTEYFVRMGDVLTHISITHDPIYLTEPLVKSEEFTLSPRTLPAQNFLYECHPVVEVANRPKGTVPAYQLGENTFLKEFMNRFKLPEAATRGGASTMYPEFNPSAQPAPPRQNPTSQAQSREQGRSLNDVQIQKLRVQGNVYMLVGAGGNTIVQVGDSGVLVVDTQLAELSDKLIAAIRTLSSKPIHYIVNTNVHDDHIGGNANIAKAGPSRPNANPVPAGLGGNVDAKTTIIAHENVLNRMVSDGPQGRPADLWPTDTYFGDEKEVFFNGEGVQILHVPAAHTDGDSLVFFRRSDVIATGDVFTTTMYPFIDSERGGTINGVIAALNRIIDLAIPDHHVQEGGTMIVPGHGRLCDEQDVIEYRDMVTIIRDRIQYMLGKGMTLEQVKAARPTLDFDGRYGQTTGAWTTDMFIETIYRDLNQKKK